jgi:hypothetical protein
MVRAEGVVMAQKSYGSKPDPTHAKGKTYPGSKTTAKLKAEGKITSSGNYDKGEPIVFPDDK